MIRRKRGSISPNGSNPRGLPLPRREFERTADGVIAVVGDEGEREDGHRHRYVLKINVREGMGLSYN